MRNNEIMYSHGYSQKRLYEEGKPLEPEDKRKPKDRHYNRDKRHYDDDKTRNKDFNTDRSRFKDHNRYDDRPSTKDRLSGEDRAYRGDRHHRNEKNRSDRSPKEDLYHREQPKQEERPRRERSPIDEEDNRRRKELEQQRNRIFKSVYKMDFENRPTLFDLAPPGHETISVAKYKDLKAAGQLPAMAMPQGVTIIPRARRLLVSNFPENFREEDLLDCINNELERRQLLLKPGGAAVDVEFHDKRESAYFRSSKETDATIQLDGIDFKGTPLKISRPPDYQPHNGCPHVFQDTLNKLFVACIPTHLTDDQVKELLTAFGELKAFNLVKDGASGVSKGYAFCEYRDGSCTDIAITGLNNMQILDKKLVVQRAVLGSRAGTNLGGIIPSMMQVPGVDPDHIISHDLLVTEVLCFLNMTTKKSLLDENEYSEIIEDIKEECSKHGEVLSVTVPKPDPNIEEYNFISRAYVHFASKESCKEAHEDLAGRKFNGRLVLTTFYDVEKYKRGEF